MKGSGIVLAAFTGLGVVGCGVESSAPSTGGQDRFVLRGRVTNLAGANLQNVTVEVQPLGGGPAVRIMRTGTVGAYRTAGIAEGLYRVIVVMGDSSRIDARGRKDTVYVGPSAESTLVGTLQYDPGRVISGSLTWSVQDTLRSVSVPFRSVKVRLLNSARTAVLDSVRTSASGSIRFAVRPGTYYLQVDTASAEFQATRRAANFPAVIPAAAIVDTLRVAATAVTNVTSTASGSLTYRAPYQIRARIFKDRNGDGVYRALATDPDTVVSGVRFWLRRVGSTANLGTSTVTSSTSTAATGNVSFTGLDNAGNRWALHVIGWLLPRGCSLSPPLTPEGDVQVTGDLPLPGGIVPTRDIPLTCTP